MLNRAVRHDIAGNEIRNPDARGFVFTRLARLAFEVLSGKRVLVMFVLIPKQIEEPTGHE